MTWNDSSRTVVIADSSNGTITQTYDDLGRLTTGAGPEGQVDYEYDVAGRRKRMTVAGIATPVTYDYYAADRLMQVAQGSAIATFGYDDANRRTSTTLPNGVVESWSFDDAGQVTGIAFDKGATHIGDLAYIYDSAGRRIGTSGSLAKLSTPASPISTSTYNDANRLTQWGSATLVYDGNGNLTTNGSTTYGWNARD